MLPDRNVTKIFIVGSREPNGITWFANCLLELGIKTYRTTPRVPAGMWRCCGDAFVLHPDEAKLKKWLPALSRHSSFRFRDGIELEWAHAWAHSSFSGKKVIFFVRDPRDTLFSRYKRERANIEFGEWLSLPDSFTLLDKVRTWCIYNRLWLDLAESGTCPDFLIFRFEDYKRDPLQSLSRLLAFIGVEFDIASMQAAIAESTSEKAMEAERSYLRANAGSDGLTINRGGMVGQWNSLYDQAAAQTIASVCADIIWRLRYSDTPSDQSPPEYVPGPVFLNCAPFWSRVYRSESLTQQAELQSATDPEQRILEFAAGGRSRIEKVAARNGFFYGASDVRELTRNLQEFLSRFESLRASLQV